MRFRDASERALALSGFINYAPGRAMTKHSPSIPENLDLAATPGFSLNERAPAHETAPQMAPETASPPERQPRAISVTTLPDARETLDESADQIATAGISNAPDSAAPVSMRKRVAALLAMIAVPAMAAPGDFGAMPGDAPSETSLEQVSANAPAKMAFETPGMTFPGSAFYYLADPPNEALVALPENDPFERGAIGGRDVGSMIDVGPAARAFFAGSGRNALRAQDCLAQAIWYEAASESEAGQRAVAQVVLNRVAHPSWPSSVCGVVYEGSQRSTGCQFTFTCDGSLVRRAPGSLRGAKWDRAQDIAFEALSGSVYAPIGHATHYHTLWVDPYWAKSLEPVGVIGAHRFYRNRGSAGEKSAFMVSYAGYEPDLSSAARAASTNAANAPSALSSKRPQRDAGNAAAKAPKNLQGKGDEAASATAKREAGQAREAYARSGQWKVDPATLGLRGKEQGKDEDKKAVGEKPSDKNTQSKADDASPSDVP